MIVNTGTWEKHNAKPPVRAKVLITKHNGKMSLLCLAPVNGKLTRSRRDEEAPHTSVSWDEYPDTST
jgi:hypothetical protein